jgi:hypothetical protein
MIGSNRVPDLWTSLAISNPQKAAVIRYFQERMPYGLFVPDVPSLDVRQERDFDRPPLRDLIAVPRGFERRSTATGRSTTAQCGTQFSPIDDSMSSSGSCVGGDRCSAFHPNTGRQRPFHQS